MLEIGMLQSLERHFNYWDSKVEDINESADSALTHLRSKHHVYHKKYRDFLDNIKRLTPNQRKDIKYIEKIEVMLANFFE